MPTLKNDQKGLYFVHNGQNEKDIESFLENVMYNCEKRVYSMHEATAVVMMDNGFNASPFAIGKDNQIPKKYNFNPLWDIKYMREFQRAQLLKKPIIAFGSSAFLVSALSGANVFLDNIEAHEHEESRIMICDMFYKNEDYSIETFGHRKQVIDPYALDEKDYLVVGRLERSDKFGVMDSIIKNEQKWANLPNYQQPEIVYYYNTESLAIAPPFYKQNDNETNGQICSLIYSAIYDEAKTAETIKKNKDKSCQNK